MMPGSPCNQWPSWQSAWPSGWCTPRVYMRGMAPADRHDLGNTPTQKNQPE